MDDGGIVYGCIMSEDNTAKHFRAATKEERNLMRGSKYIQSNLESIFVEVKKDLSEERLVLFSGTPCQIAGLKAFLKKEYKNLILVDLICHGVPSPKVWDQYLTWIQENEGKPIQKTVFRNKNDFGWKSHVESFYFQDGTRNDKQIFKTLFYKHLIVRECCFCCPYRNIIHPADITIGDFWAIDRALPGYKDDKGVSMVLANNVKGNRLISRIKDVDILQCKIEDSTQKPLMRNYSVPQDIENFWKDFEDQGISYVAKKYGEYGTHAYIRRQARRGINLIRRSINRLHR